MSSKGEILPKISFRRCIMTIIILCTSVWWASADTLAQEAAPAWLKMTAHSTLWPLEVPGSNMTPHLVIGMADRQDAPSYGSLRNRWRRGNESVSRNTTTRQGGPDASAASS